VGLAAAVWAMTAVTGASAVKQGIDASKADKQQKVAMQQAKKAADADAIARDQEFNAQNKKKPTLLAGLMAQNAKGGKAGSTMLTGPQGVGDPLSLGKSTLLGS